MVIGEAEAEKKSTLGDQVHVKEGLYCLSFTLTFSILACETKETASLSLGRLYS